MESLLLKLCSLDSLTKQRDEKREYRGAKHHAGKNSGRKRAEWAGESRRGEREQWAELWTGWGRRDNSAGRERTAGREKTLESELGDARVCVFLCAYVCE